MPALSITRKTANTLATAAAMNTNYGEIEAVVNALDADNFSADSVKAVALNSDVVRSGYGLIQHTDGSLYVDVSDTNPSLEITDGGLRAKVYGVINRTANGLTWGRAGDMLLSSSATTPDGFSDVSSTYADKMIRISATALSTGGADTHTHAAGSFAGPSHTHTLPNQDYQVDRKTGGGDVGATKFQGSGADAQAWLNANGITSAAGGTGAITGTSASGDNVPAYVTLKMYQAS